MNDPFGVNIPLILALGFVLIVVVIGIIYTPHEMKKLREISQKGMNAMWKECPVCSGELEEGRIMTTGFFSIKTPRKRYRIAAVRCKQCGYTALFS